MEKQLDVLIERIANASANLAPWTELPVGGTPVEPIRSLLQHLTTSNVHDVYCPYIRFGAMQAARAAIGWATLTRGRESVSAVQDMFGYFVVSWGGGTLSAMLTSSPAAWLVSPVPWIVYTAVYLLFIRTGLASFMMQTAPSLPFNLFLAAVDGMSRGVTVASIPGYIANSPVAAGGWWSAAIFSALMTNGGGWVVGIAGLHKADWTPGRPKILDGGVLGTLDVWGAMLCSVVYSALTRTYPAALDPVTARLAGLIPDELLDANVQAAGGGPVSVETARAITVFLLGSLFAARVITTTVLGWLNTPRVVIVKREPPVNDAAAKAAPSVVKSPVEAAAVDPSASPKKRRARKSKTKSPGPEL